MADFIRRAHGGRDEGRDRNQPAGLGKVILRGLPWVLGLIEKRPRAIEMDVGQEQRHRPALSYFSRFVHIALCALGPGSRVGEIRYGSADTRIRPARARRARRESLYIVAV